jgi:hypothetical protein
VANALLAPLGNYGGPTQTIALLAGSPALSAGVAVNGLSTDQRGATRSNPPSIGAYEGPGLTLSRTTLDLGTTTYGTAGKPLTYTVSGNNLTANLSIMAPGGVQISTDGSTWSSSLTLTPSNGTLARTTIDVRLGPTATPGGVSGTIADTGGGAREQDVSLSGTVNRATPTVRVSDAGGTYTGKPYAATATVAGVNGVFGPSLDSVTPTLTYYAGTYPLGGLPASGGSGTDPSTAGRYTVVATFAGSIDYGSARALATFTITRANATIVVTGYNVTYDGTPHTASGLATGVGGQALSGLVLSGTKHTNAGNYPGDTWKFTDTSGNYNNASGTVHDLIAQATLTVTANPETKVYGSADPTLTYTASGFRFTDTAATVLKGKLTRAAGETVAGGPYAISQGTLAANSNYKIAFTGSTLSITPATLTVTAQNASRIYGVANPTFTYAINGFVNGDSSSVVSGTPTLTTSATANSPPGNYAIDVNVSPLSAANYTFQAVNGTLTVLPAPVSAGIFTWIGVTSGDWFAASNWSTEAVPGPADTAVIQGAPFDPVLSASAAVGGLVMDSGSLTLDANLTDSGTLTQGGGTVNLNANQLQVAGNVTRTGGTMPGTTGTLVLNGTAAQTFMDTTFNKLPALTISNTSAAGVTLPGGSNVGVRTGGGGITLNAGSTLTLLQGAAASFLIDRGNFTDNGKIALCQLSPNGGSATALITINGTLAFGGTSALDLTVSKLAANAVYTFLTYGATTGAVGTTTIHGNFPFAATAGITSNALTVTLSSPGTIDTWTGGVSNDWFTAANWTAADGSHAVPGASDLAVIAGAPFATVLSANATVGGLEFSNGFLTINANLTVTGPFNPDTGFLAFGSDADQLILDGDVTRKSGTFLGTAGTVVFAGAAQSVIDTSGRTFGWNVVVNSGDTVTVQPGSAVSVGNDFTDNGTVNLSMAAPSIATPLLIGRNLVEGAGSVFNLALGDTNAGLVYIFLTFVGTDPGGAAFHTNAGTVNHNGNSISVTS